MLASKLLIIVFIIIANLYIGNVLEKVSKISYSNVSTSDVIQGYVPFVNLTRIVRLASSSGVIQVGTREIGVILFDVTAIISSVLWFVMPKYSPRNALLIVISLVVIISFNSLDERLGIKKDIFIYSLPVIMFCLPSIWYAIFELTIFLFSIKLDKFVKAVIEVNTKSKEQRKYSPINSWKEENDMSTRDLEQWNNLDD